MPDSRRRRCTCCGKTDDKVGPISWRGNCVGCSIALVEENVVGIATATGPAHKRRLRGYAKWLNRELLDAGPVARHSDG